ncbi:hypothetical protein ACPCSE_29495 [Streptomyces cellulosae]
MKSRTDAVADWFISRSLRTALPLIMMTLAVINFVEAALNPVVTVEASSEVATPLQGTVASVGVELADPNLTDRLVASLPDLLSLALIVLGYSYMMWQGRTHDFDEKQAKRAVLAFSAAGLLVVLAPSLIIVPTMSSYFDVRLPESTFGPSSMLVTASFAVLLVAAVGNRTEWMKEHDRAKKLNDEMENVV